MAAGTRFSAISPSAARPTLSTYSFRLKVPYTVTARRPPPPPYQTRHWRGPLRARRGPMPRPDASDPVPTWGQRIRDGLASLNPSRTLFLSSFAWNTLLAHQLIMYPFPAARLLSYIRPVTFLTAEISQAVGGLRLGYAALALQACLTRSLHGQQQASFVLAFMGITQTLLGLAFWGKGRWIPGRLVALLFVEASLGAAHLIHYLRPVKSGKE